MIPRYSLPEMSAIWSEERKLAVWQEVEALVVEGWAELGLVPAEAARAVRAAAPVDPAAWMAREETTDHDLAAFVDVLAENAGPAGEWVHYGLTSSDVLDTALGVLLKESAGLLLRAVEELFRTVKAKALHHRDTIMVGRTHGVWAEPTTFGLKLATWAFELARNHDRLAAARTSVAVGKISGAVGTYAHTPPELEAYVCEKLGVVPEPASSQVTHRDRHAAFLQALALTGTSIERFATEIRHLQRSEVGEVREAFRSGQKGSSAMPHKRNPILSERMTGMARLLRGYSQVALENVALWHERDLTHSAAERVILPDACTILHYMLVKFTAVVEGLVVDATRMQKNLEATRGLVFSHAVLLALVDRGQSRDDAYRIVQRNAMAAWEGGMHLRDLLEADPDVALSRDELAGCFTSERALDSAAVVFERLEAVNVAGD